MASMVVTLDEGEMTLARTMATRRRETSRARWRRDRLVGNDEENMEKELLGACGELAFTKTFNLEPDTGYESGEADTMMPDGRSVDVKTTANPIGGLRVSEIARKCDLYVLVRKITDTQYFIKGWATKDEVLAASLVAGRPDHYYVPPYDLRSCNCPNFFEGANRSAAPRPGDPGPPPPLSGPLGSCKFQPVVQS